MTVASGLINDSLVVHLPFEGNFNDISGHGNNAAYATNGTNASPTPTFVPGVLGQAFVTTTKADGSQFEYATLGYPDDLKFGDSTSFAVSMWVNYTNQADDPPFISNKDWNSSSDPGWGIFTQDGGNFRVNVTGPTSAGKFSVTPATTLRDGTWHHLVVSFVRAATNPAAYSYVDGALVDQTAYLVNGSIDTYALPFSNHQGLTTGQTNWAVNIGQDGTGVYDDNTSAHNIGAKLDDLGIWRRALSAEEAQAIHTAGLAGKDLSHAVTRLSLTVSGSNVLLEWPAKSTVKLQTTPDLSPAHWQDVPNTLGTNSVTVPMTKAPAYFRLSQ